MNETYADTHNPIFDLIISTLWSKISNLTPSHTRIEEYSG
jgi:hypothetical protein